MSEILQALYPWVQDIVVGLIVVAINSWVNQKYISWKTRRLNSSSVTVPRSKIFVNEYEQKRFNKVRLFAVVYSGLFALAIWVTPLDTFSKVTLSSAVIASFTWFVIQYFLLLMRYSRLVGESLI